VHEPATFNYCYDVADIECCCTGGSSTGSLLSAIVQFVHPGVHKGAEFYALASSQSPVVQSFITRVKSATQGRTY
jgi:hypothetical protein